MSLKLRLRLWRSKQPRKFRNENYDLGSVHLCPITLLHLHHRHIPSFLRSFSPVSHQLQSPIIHTHFGWHSHIPFVQSVLTNYHENSPEYGHSNQYVTQPKSDSWTLCCAMIENSAARNNMPSLRTFASLVTSKNNLCHVGFYIAQPKRTVRKCRKCVPMLCNGFLDTCASC